MKIKKRFTSAIAAVFLVSLGSVSINAISAFSPLPQTAQAQTTYCKNRSFTAKALFKVNVRADRSTSSPIVAVLNPGTYQFSTWEEGQSIPDSWTGQPDNKWYKLADGRGWVASAVIAGYPPQGCPINVSVYQDPLKGKGTITQRPGGATSHTGRAQYAIDFGTPIGTPVYAMRAGTVVKLEDRFADTGGGEANKDKANFIAIEHVESNGSRVRSGYVHLQRGFISKTGIKIGQQVQAGQLIGYSGNSGWSTNPHLHVEVHIPNANGTFGQTIPFSIQGRY
ncbi:peptidase M23 domain-containing protein [Tolypothrix tenuis PCC 7101]|uniref:Peptidase M23 domain-containing protein n=1 Tax=Tolypothrix tenuis PCC 7101 TaxID=231146 RepID=A0A1Z4N231_9CYAN|nr:M23 family metallopeptidase [Aulosira sp. FACHB-113]BAY99769.1 peptidase M23 domain-containing protein [Tolypothrix tenuis PCC 7101]BAZ76309.1 peptidase M23 domain-containing protein [Aulosira laxa NIES-50]